MGSIRLSTGSRPRSQVGLPSRVPGIKVAFGAAYGKGALCEAVAAIGRVLSYLFDPVNARQKLIGFFRHVYDAPPPGGVFVFTLCSPVRSRRKPRPQGFCEGVECVVLV